jgi:hypothetical protein
MAGGHTRWLEGGLGVNILEDVRHSSVLYVCKCTLCWNGRGKLSADGNPSR